MRSLVFLLLLACGTVYAQDSKAAAPSTSSPGGSSPSKASNSDTAKHPNLAPPRADVVNADSLDDGDSSSKDTQVDLSPPPDDAKHPGSSDILMDEGTGAKGDANEFHPWDPHRAAKDIEVGDFYFKRKNYKAAEDRYREALLYKNNDALATYRLAVCLGKMDRPEEARAAFENYLQILPYGPQASDAKAALERLKGTAANAKPAK